VVDPQIVVGRDRLGKRAGTSKIAARFEHRTANYTLHSGGPRRAIVQAGIRLPCLNRSRRRPVQLPGDWSLLLVSFDRAYLKLRQIYSMISLEDCNVWT
jgi:hypothetical protein